MALDCDKVRELLSAFVDEELTAEEKSEVSEHLQSCSECRRERDSYYRLRNRLRSGEEEPLPAEFSARLHEALMAEPKRSEKVVSFPKKRVLSLVAAAACLALIVVGAMHFRPSVNDEGMQIASVPSPTPEDGGITEENTKALANMAQTPEPTAEDLAEMDYAVRKEQQTPEPEKTPEPVRTPEPKQTAQPEKTTEPEEPKAEEELQADHAPMVAALLPEEQAVFSRSSGGGGGSAGGSGGGSSAAAAKETAEEEKVIYVAASDPANIIAILSPYGSGDTVRMTEEQLGSVLPVLQANGCTLSETKPANYDIKIITE